MCLLGSLYLGGFLLPTVFPQSFLALAKLNFRRRQWIHGGGGSNVSYLLIYKQGKWLFSHKLDLTLSGVDSVYSFPPTSNSWRQQTAEAACLRERMRNVRIRTVEMELEIRRGVPRWLSELIIDS